MDYVINAINPLKNIFPILNKINLSIVDKERNLNTETFRGMLNTLVNERR